MGTNSMLLKSHRHRTLGISDLCRGKRLMAALTRVQGEGLQRQAAEQKQRRSGEHKGQGEAPLLWVKQTHPRSTNLEWSIPRCMADLI